MRQKFEEHITCEKFFSSSVFSGPMECRFYNPARNFKNSSPETFDWLQNLNLKYFWRKTFHSKATNEHAESWPDNSAHLTGSKNWKLYAQHAP